MKSVLISIFSVLIFQFTWAQNKGEQAKIQADTTLPKYNQVIFDQPDWSNKPADVKLPYGSVIHDVFSSKLYRGKKIGFSIYLPDSYFLNKNKKFPVIYWLHGGTGNESSEAGVSWDFSNAMKNNQFPDCIIVFPNGFYYSFWHNDYTFPSVDSQKIQVQSLFVNELIPFVESKYRIDNIRKTRTIIGFSMGGYGAFYNALSTGIFNTCISLDGGIYLNKNTSDGYNRSFNNDSTKIYENLPLNLICNYSGNLDKIAFYFITSTMGVSAHKELEFEFSFMNVSSKFDYLDPVKHSATPFLKQKGNEIFKFIKDNWHEKPIYIKPKTTTVIGSTKYFINDKKTATPAPNLRKR